MMCIAAKTSKNIEVQREEVSVVGGEDFPWLQTVLDISVIETEDLEFWAIKQSHRN